MNATETMKGPKLWTKDFIVIMILALFNSVCMQMMNPTMPLYLKQLGGSTAVGGLANGLLAISALIFRPISGYLVEKVGRKKLILAGSVIFSMGILFVNIIPSIPFTLIARFIQGIGFSLVTTSCGTVVTDIVPGERLNEGIGYYGLSNSLSTALGPSIALYIISSLGYWWLFSIIFMVVIFVILIGTTVNYEKRPEFARVKPVKKEEPGNKSPRAVIGTLFEKTALPASIVQFILVFGTSSIFNFLAYYGLSIGIEGIGMFFTVSAIFMVASRLIVGKLINRFGTRNLLICCMIVAGFTYFTLIFASQLIHFVIIGAIHGFLSGIIYASLNITAVRDAAPNRRGVATATYLCSMDLGVGIGSIFWGKIADLAGFKVVFFFTAIIVFICLFFTFMLIGKKSINKVMG